MVHSSINIYVLEIQFVSLHQCPYISYLLLSRIFPDFLEKLNSKKKKKEKLNSSLIFSLAIIYLFPFPFIVCV